MEVVMNTQNKTTLGLLVSGLILFSAFGKSRKQARLDNAGRKKVALQTWEGEGGTVPFPTAANPPERVNKS